MGDTICRWNTFRNIFERIFPNLIAAWSGAPCFTIIDIVLQPHYKQAGPWHGITSTINFSGWNGIKTFLISRFLINMSCQLTTDNPYGCINPHVLWVSYHNKWQLNIEVHGINIAGYQLYGFSNKTWTCCLRIDNTGVQQTSVGIIHIYVYVCLCGCVWFCADMDINDNIDNVGNVEQFIVIFVPLSFYHMVNWNVWSLVYTKKNVHWCHSVHWYQRFLSGPLFAMCCLAYLIHRYISVQKEPARKMRLYHSNGFFICLNRTHVEWGFQFWLI